MQIQKSNIHDIIEKINQLSVYLKDCITILQKINKKKDDDKKKGSACSINGKKYELEVYNVVKNSKINGNSFNTQLESELGGCSFKNDI